ncbi:hypothetical protein PAXRUDRAFT_11344 [Paxillus rubicundulus Ve08.2h10]|uniref:Uncharacterized protein n=1 Tax=Paxillus rubicundulus Ve08.2h10 TaxID=930991 RepID=A0A0D0E3R7_9AGAM|nr:hypothetical protein PAXRUDRAFT_11344 [Paxillus rubicundulus Ve08.2h10]
MSLEAGKYIIGLTQYWDKEHAEVRFIGRSPTEVQTVVVLPSDAQTEPPVWHISEDGGRYTIRDEDGIAISPKNGQLQVTGEATTWEIAPYFKGGGYRVTDASGNYWTVQNGELTTGTPVIISPPSVSTGILQIPGAQATSLSGI